jgi:hypothetical protein
LSQTTSSFGQCFCAAASVTNKCSDIVAAGLATGVGGTIASHAAIAKQAASRTIMITLPAPGATYNVRRPSTAAFSKCFCRQIAPDAAGLAQCRAGTTIGMKTFRLLRYRIVLDGPEERYYHALECRLFSRLKSRVGIQANRDTSLRYLYVGHRHRYQVMRHAYLGVDLENPDLVAGGYLEFALERSSRNGGEPRTGRLSA